MFNKLDVIEEKLGQGKTIFGTHTVLGGGVTAEIFGTVGFDALWIDAEHGALDRKDILETIIGASGTNMATFVRVAWNDMVLAKPILEMGCDGIIFPMVCTADEAEAAVAACAYPPKGIRGFGPYRAQGYGVIPADEYVKEQSKKIWTIVQIEHMDAVKNIDEIIAVEGIDLFIVGACDLSASMGPLPDTANQEVKKVLDFICDKLHAAGKRYGISMGYDEEIVNDWVRRKANFIFVENDIGYLFNGAQTALNNLRKVVGQTE